MSFWRRLFGKRDQGPAEVDREPSATVDSAVTEVENEVESDARREEQKRLSRARRVGREHGADVTEAIALLRRHAGQRGEQRALDALLEGLSHPAVAGDGAFDPLRAALGTLLAERGRPEQALALVRGARSVEAMMLAAELHAGAGELGRAVTTMERVLARDIDTPGARERHQRWSEQLGLIARRAPAGAESATVVAPELEQQSHIRLLREVARGAAGTIYQAEDELLGRRLAYKIYHRGERDRGQVEREARAAARFHGPGTVRVFDADPGAGWVAMEWAAGGSLRDALDGRVADVLPALGWVTDIAGALARVHASGWVHGDVKPANILLRGPGDAVLTDFGVCQPAGSEGLAGTPGYISPERLSGAPADPRDDVYAMGRVLEDLLGVREEADLRGELREATRAEARLLTRLCLDCLRDAQDRPPDAAALVERLADRPER